MGEGGIQSPNGLDSLKCGSAWYDEAWDLPTSLLTYLIPHQDDVTISTETGAESPICGSASVPCKTLELGLTRVSNAACICNSAVDLGSIYVLINKNVTVKGQSIESSSLVFREFQSIVCSYNTPTSSPAITITTITLNIIATSSDREGFVVIENGHVKITKVKVACQALHAPALYTSGGTPVLSELTFAVPSHTSDIIVFTSQTTFENTNIAGITSQFFEMNNTQKSQLTSLTFTGSSPSPSSSSNEELCSWEGGVIHIMWSEPTIKKSSFSSISSGVMSVVSSTVTLVECTFSKNIAGITSHPNLQRNIYCQDSSVTIDQNSVFVQNSETDPVSLWISQEQSEVELPSTISKSSILFVPTLPETLTTEAYNDSSIPKVNEAQRVTINGSNFVDCGLSFVVVLTNKDVDDSSAITFNLTETVPRGFSAFDTNDSSISFIIDPKTAKMSDGFYSLHVLINNETIATYKLLEVTVRKKALNVQQKTAMAIIIPTVTVVALAVLTIIILICVCKKRQKEKKEDEVDEELAENNALMNDQSEYFQPSEAVIDMADMSKINAEVDIPIPSDGHKANRIVPDSLPYFLMEPRRKADTGLSIDSKICVLCRDPDIPLTFADQRMNLFERIHGDGSTFDEKPLEAVGIEGAGKGTEKPMSLTPLSIKESVSVICRLGKTLQLLKERGDARAPLNAESREAYPPFCIRGVTSHSILLYPDGSLLIALPTAFVTPIKDALPIDDHVTLASIVLAEDTDSPRWYAPENEKTAVLTPEESTGAVVFSLAMVLFEMLTQEVPFKEMDAVNAHRQIKSGQLPNLNLINEMNNREQDEQEQQAKEVPADLSTILEKAMSFNASERPTLKEFVSSLEGLGAL
ncbi:hypothetical protein BLNAU_9280 [Blattamonas nauphoetae]|uniref:Protein kinase domain-containing protein n=1 Tax=Blattamonas nauphoetae TaxID=2049346 RepID=A0ABQ9XW88_9EUKA|nr:hypothetical protein BLNAU_9280 [Blattamonas nauphoetae]